MNLLFVLLAFFADASTDNLVRPLTSSPQILIPAAGAVAGAQQTFFRSDIHIINFANRQQRVRLQWMPQGVSGLGITPREIDIGAASGFFSEDFVTNVMLQSGLGSILVTGITAEGAADPTAQLYATSRIWTPQPGTTGTTSQTLPTLDVASISSTQQGIFGIRRDDRYRANMGIVNLSTNQQRYAIIVLTSSPPSSTTTVVEVPAFSMQQIGLSSGTGVLQIVVNNVSDGTRSSLWTAYASSVDNVTGDSWSMVGFNSP